MFFVFVLGLILGSFYNVVIMRTLSGESLFFPSSHCVWCKTPIEWKYNIPIFSYLFLKGKCKYCSKPIDILYPIVELITGIMLLFLYLKFGISAKTVIAFVCMSLFLILAGMDIKSKTVSFKYTVILMFCSLLFNFNSLQNSVFGGLLCFCLMKVVLLLSKKGNKSIIGDGDLYGVTALGAFLGISHIAFLFVVLIFSSGVIALPKFIKQYNKDKTYVYFVWFILAYIPVLMVHLKYINTCLLLKILINVNLLFALFFLSKRIVNSLFKMSKALYIPLYPSIFFTALLFLFLF